MMTTTTLDFLDPEENRRRVARLVEECGGTEGYIGQVVLGPAIVEARPPGTRIVEVPPSFPPAGDRAAAEGSYAARDSGPESADAAVLLDKIHRQYLGALAAVDKKFVGRHARGMLFAGYTYGLLPDPVLNILANSLWYDFRFPPSSRRETRVKMLSGKAIFRMAVRSRDALLAFMKYLVPTLSTADIYSLLAQVNGNLWLAIELHGCGGHERQQGAFRAAVLAAGLPNEAVQEAHLSFVTCYDSVRRLMEYHRHLISPSILRNFYQIPGIHFVPKPYLDTRAVRGSLTSSSRSLSPAAYRASRLKIHSFKMEEDLSMAIADKALQKLALQHGGPYELHMICGKNFVALPPESYYHINFFASPVGDNNVPTLFFAEVRGAYKDVKDVTLCCPVTEANGRCLVCEYYGAKLLHPDDKEFNGLEYSEVDCRMTDRVLEFSAPLNEDYVFFEPDQHPEIANFLEANYSSMSLDQVDLSFLWFENYVP